MAVNLWPPLVGSATALLRVCRPVPGRRVDQNLAAEVRRNEEALAGYREAMECHLGNLARCGPGDELAHLGA